jgi:translocation and assembly module TamB
MKRILLGIIIFLLVVQLLIAALLGTQLGSRWLLQRVLPLVPGQLQVEQINGTLLEGIAVKNLSYQLNELNIALASGSIAIDPNRLWQGWLQADYLYLNDLHISLPPSRNTEKEPFALPDNLYPPFGFAISTAQLQGFQLKRQDNVLLQLDQVSLDDGAMRFNLRIANLSAQLQQQQASFSELQMKLSAPYQVAAQLQWHGELAELEGWLGDSTASGQAKLTGSLEKLAIDHQLNTPQELSSQVLVELFSRKINFSSDHQWQQLLITLPDQRIVELQTGKLKLNSAEGDVSLTAQTGVTLENIVRSNINITAEGDWQHARIISIRSDSKENQLKINGEARWLPSIAFNVIVEGERINPALINPNLPGSLKLSGNVQGRQEVSDHQKNKQPQRDWHINANAVRVSGLLRELPIEANLTAALAGNLFSLHGDLDYDQNNLVIDGRINHNIDIRSQLKMANPENIIPSLQGSADINLHLYGSRSEPLLDIEASSDRLNLASYVLKDIRISGRQLGPQSESMELSASSSKLLQFNQPLLEASALQFSGSYDDHRLNWSLSQRDATLSGSLKGDLDGALSGNIGNDLRSLPLSWQGIVDQLTLSLTDYSDWNLSEPAALSLSAQQQSLDKVCLTNGVGAACVSANVNRQGLSASAGISALPLAPFASLLGPDVRMSGEIQHHTNVLRDSSGNWRGTSHTAFTDAIIFLDDGAEDYPLAFDVAELSAVVEQQQLQAQANILMTEHGHLRAQLTSSMDNNAPLQGNIDLAITELRWLELLSPGIRVNSGSIAGQLTISGQNLAPTLQGALKLQQGEVDIAEAGLTLRDITSELTASGKKIQINASAQSGPGSIEAQGLLDLTAGLPGVLQLDLRGSNFQVINLADATVLVDPAITLQGNRERFLLRGEINIPQAYLAPQQLPEVAVKVSEDQVIMNAPQSSVVPRQLDAKLQLHIGKDVRFSGFGLNARLGGNLQFIKRPEKPAIMLGDLRIEEGRYRAYGQNLEIEHGLLLFQEKVDNPGLNIRAVRRIPSAQVVAGVEITGTLQKPESRLVSEPAMEESEAMAWLLTGRGLSGGSETDNAMIAQALALYGLQQGSGVASKLGDKLGFDDVTLGSDWESSDAALMLGKQINDELYLRYAIGLFDAVSTVMLRYTLSRRLHLEAQSGGDKQSIDLIYQVER